MYSFTLLIVAAVIGLALAKGHHYYQCEPCRGEECDVVPEGCLYGTDRDPCGRVRCMAGPRQRCGGRDHHLGKCGDGMRCMCGRCFGCSTLRFYNEGVYDCENSLPYPCV